MTYFYVSWLLTALTLGGFACATFLKSPKWQLAALAALVVKLLYTDYQMYLMFEWTGTAFMSVFQTMQSLAGQI